MASGVSRRTFLQLSLAATAGLGAGVYAVGRAGAALPLPVTEPVPVDRWVYSTCGFCGTGCGIEMGVKDHQVVAIRGTADHPVNQGKLCAKGIYQWQMITAPDRGTRPLVRRDGKLQPATWDEALDLMAERFKAYSEQYGPDSIAIYNTGQMTMEEYYVLGKLARAGLRTSRLDGNTRMCMASAVVGHIRSFGTDGPVGGYEDIEQTDLIFLLGSNMSECHPILFGRVVRARAARGTKLIVVDPRLTQAARMADLYLPIKPGTDLVLLNAMAHVLIREGMVNEAWAREHTTGYDELVAHLEKYTPGYAAEICGVPAADIVTAARMYGQSPTALSMWVMGINQSVNGTAVNNALHNLALITGKIGRPGCGSFSITGQPAAMASREVGGSSGYPGYRAIANAKHREEVARFWGVDPAILPDKSPAIEETIDDILAGKVKALWVICTNPVISLPDQNRVIKALSMLDLLVVQDAYESADTVQYADIYLPAAMWAEKSGLFVNSERRVNLLQPAVAPPGEARTDFDIFLDLARRMGFGHLFPYRNTEECFEEIKQITRGRPNDYSGMSYPRIEAMRGIQWPCPEPDHPGTPRLYADGRFNTPDGKAKLWALDPEPLPEEPSAEFPFWVNTGRVQEHYHTGTKTRKVERLNQLVPTAYVELNPRDAAELGIDYGDLVELENSRGRIRCKAVITEQVAPGSCFVPMHFNEGPVNALTVWAWDKFSKEPNFKQAAVRLRKVAGSQEVKGNG